MLNSHERRVWRDIQRNYADEVDGPPPADLHHLDWRPSGGRSVDQLPTAVGMGIWATILLILFGAALAGFVVGAGTAVGWLLWRYRPSLRGDDPAGVDPFDEAIRRRAPRDRDDRRPAAG